MLPASRSAPRRSQPIPPPKHTRIAAIVATSRRPVSTRARDQATRASAAAISALERKKTGMIGTFAALAAIAPWKSANQ